MSIVVIFLTFSLFAYFLWDYFNNKRCRELLSKIPSPKAVPFFSHAGHFVNKLPEDILRTLTKFSQELGSIWYFTIPGSTQIMISDPKVAAVILSSQKLIEKSSDYGLIVPWLGTGLLISGGKKWHQRRKIITPAFHFKILQQFVDVMERQGQILIEKLKKFDGQDENIFPHVSLYAMDVICESAMGYQLNAQTDAESEYVKSVKEITNILFLRFFDVFLHTQFIYRFTRHYQREKRAIEKMHAFTNAIIEERRNYLQSNSFSDKYADDVGIDDVGGRRKHAFLDLLLQSKVDGKLLEAEDVREEVDTFMFEGHDTTTSGIAFCLLNIAKYPEVQEKVYEECLNVLGDKKSISVQDLNQLNYLENVIKESMRMYPPVPFFSRNITAETDVGNWTIPKGVCAMISPLFIGRDSSIFPDPLKFDPLRFENEHMNPFSYVPFSAGPRNCIGQKFAMLELKSVISKVVKNFEISVKKENEEPTLVSELILRSKEGIILALKART